MEFDELKKYINTTAVQIDTNWNLKGNNFMNETNFEMKPCTLQDFGEDEVSAKYFYSWNGFMLLCPKTQSEEGKELSLFGAWGMNETSRIQFRVDRCVEEDTGN